MPEYEFYMEKYRVEGERSFRTPCCIWTSEELAKKHLKLIKKDLASIGTKVIATKVMQYKPNDMRRPPCNCESQFKRRK